MKTSRISTPPPSRGAGSAPSVGDRAAGRPLSPGRALMLPGAFALGLVAFGLLLPAGQLPELRRAFLGAGGAALAWLAVLYVAARRSGRTLTLEVVIHRHHWVQACAQGTVFLWWGWHVRFVYAFFPLLLAQLLFAYAVDALLGFSRRGRYALGFGPFPIIGSINLFLWFRPEFFHWQFAMVAGGMLAKEFVRWTREGRSAHIFNPSSFPLAVAALVLIATGTSEVTFGRQIVTSQFNVPLIYLVIFLAALPGQLLFGVARMTMSAVVTLWAISVLYFGASGTYLFFDSHIPVPVFLGMHLLFTDPSTSPRSGTGRVMFGVLYAVGVAVSYVILGWIGAPTYFDKLLPLPFLNLLVRRIDAFAAAVRWPWRGAALGELSAGRRHLAYTSLWAAAFLGLSAIGGVGDRHPGHALPFWEEACREGSERACGYATQRLSIYCSQGSGWACNEWALRQAPSTAPARGAFRRGCELGFGPACENARRSPADPGPPARAAVPIRELPIVLSWKRKVGDAPPAELLALACEQGWPGTCG